MDIFVHSLTFNNGYTNGSKYIFNTPVSHVDTFVLNLTGVTPSTSAVTPQPLPSTLNGQKSSTSITVSYYVQCASGFLGDYCDLQCDNYTSNSAICKSTVKGDHQLCQYDTSNQQVRNCTFCDYRPGNNSCANIFVTSKSVVSAPPRSSN